LVVNFSAAASMKLEYHSITAKASHSVGLGQEHAKRDDVSFLEGEGLWSDRSTLVGSPVKTFGRFSVRGPAAWRKDGGTGKNSNTMRNACKALRHDL